MNQIILLCWIITIVSSDCLADCQDQLIKCTTRCLNSYKLTGNTDQHKQICHETCMQIEQRPCQRKCIVQKS